MREEFARAVRQYQAEFGLELSDGVVERLADFYDLVQSQNEILHLVGPCTPAEFATRHVLESLTLLKHLPQGALVADIGPGGGFPSIPCLIARDDLSAVLIESKEKKTNFLLVAASNLFSAGRVEVINSQFEEVRDRSFEFVTCRALDKFVDKLPRLVRWSGKATLLFYGGNAIREAFDKLRIDYATERMPLSEQRYLFVSKRRQ